MLLLSRPDYEHYMQSGTDIPLIGTAQQNIQIFRKHAVVGQQCIFFAIYISTDGPKRVQVGNYIGQKWKVN